MSSRYVLLSSLLILIIAGCSPANSIVGEVTTTPDFKPASPHLSPTSSLTPSPTPQPTSTFTPTPYPTFRIEDLITRTPAPEAECPSADPGLTLEVDVTFETNPRDYLEIVQGALDSGASFKMIADAFHRSLGSHVAVYLLDITGDGSPELIWNSIFALHAYGCVGGEHRYILGHDTGSPGPGSSPKIFAVEDMNLNGTPELVLHSFASTGGNSVVEIIEWDGAQFVPLMLTSHGENAYQTSRWARALNWYQTMYGFGAAVMNGGADIAIRDLDGNGTKELILTDHGPKHPDTVRSFGPWRGKQVVYIWDGLHFIYSSLEMDAPTYRFQAVQDADQAVLAGTYDKALELYHQAIYSDDLAYWSPDNRKYLRSVYDAEWFENPTPTPPPPDENEEPILVGYSTYRIILLHLLRGEDKKAQDEYERMQLLFPPEETGHLFSDLATVLLNEYQSSGNLAQACTKVVAQAASFEEDFLPYLGSQEHGSQSHIYILRDICPVE